MHNWELVSRREDGLSFHLKNGAEVLAHVWCQDQEWYGVIFEPNPHPKSFPGEASAKAWCEAVVKP